MIYCEDYYVWSDWWRRGSHDCHSYHTSLQSTPQYALLLNPIIQTGTSTDMHVMVQNTGKAPLTNVRVDYGPGAKADVIPVLNPGEKVWLSPSNIDTNNKVVVTDDQGVTVSKSYTEPTKTPLADSD
ncbi:MAG: hypothetical protein ACYDAJ_07380 [Nitrosotalea sp.]